MSKNSGIPAFKAFLESVQASKHEDYSKRTSSKVAHDDAFKEMKAHILKLYDRVEVQHSFVDANGSIFDCVPIEQQPSLKGSKESVPKAPDLPHTENVAGAADERKAHLIASPLGHDKRDAHGNAMHCPEGTIPMRRVTLEDLTRFDTLKSFFQKAPGEVRPPQSSASGIASTVPATHRWAHAFQNVNNGGGHSFLNIWDPPIGANQIFSLSQHWYVAGSGTGLQTAECGWQVYPQFYGGNTKPVFFIYWTADGYHSTGCYNTTCSAFVHTAGTFTPGMTLGPISVSGGAQYEFELAFWHTGGRWWLYVNGTAGSNAIGYYPDSIYQGGAMTAHATEIDYGGEVVGTTSFPRMGSGAFANAGWQKAAYQKAINYYTPTGGAVIAGLTPAQATPQCYTAQVNKFAAPWNETLWYGGPGGNNC